MCGRIWQIHVPSQPCRSTMLSVRVFLLRPAEYTCRRDVRMCRVHACTPYTYIHACTPYIHTLLQISWHTCMHTSSKQVHVHTTICACVHAYVHCAWSDVSSATHEAASDGFRNQHSSDSASILVLQPNGAGLQRSGGSTRQTAPAF